MTETNIQLEAIGEFPFSFWIEKAVAEETTEKELILEGVASTANIDHDNERMSKEALNAMATVINEKTVPLRVEHSKSDNAVIGKVYKAWVDDRNQLHIRASLDKSHPVSTILHSSMMENGKKMGFSVGGLVKRAVKEFSASVGKLVKTFYDVELKEVSVTPRPANYDSWCKAKDIAKSEEEIEKSRGTGFYDEFLFANPQLDYLQVFAKSVPDEAWHSSPIINKNTMTTETETKEKAEKETETADTTKTVSRKDFSTVVKGIETLSKAFSALVEKLDTTPKDQYSPEKKKELEEGQQTAKSGEDAHDQNNPDKAKEKEEGEQTAKDGSTDYEDTKEKAEHDTDDYKIESVTRAISTLEGLTKRIQGIKKAQDVETDSKEEEKSAETDTETKEKASETDEETKKVGDEKDETTTKAHPLDAFVGQVTKTIEAMVERMEKSGVSIPGFEKSQVEKILRDPSMQEEIQKMIKIPGRKQSMSLGVPYMVTKEGRRYNLTATEVGAPTVEKSRTSDDSKKTFKQLYNEKLSSFNQEQE